MNHSRPYPAARAPRNLLSWIHEALAPLRRLVNSPRVAVGRRGFRLSRQAAQCASSHALGIVKLDASDVNDDPPLRYDSGVAPRYMGSQPGINPREFARFDSGMRETVVRELFYHAWNVAQERLGYQEAEWRAVEHLMNEHYRTHPAASVDSVASVASV